MYPRILIGLWFLVTSNGLIGQDLFSLRPADKHTSKLITFSKGDDIVIWSKNGEDKKKIKGKLIAKEGNHLIIKRYLKQDNSTIDFEDIEAVKRPNYKRAIPITIILITAGVLTSDPDTFLFNSPLNWAIPLGVYGIIENQILRKKMHLDNNLLKKKHWEIILD